ncbi:hypothetical protein G6F31_021711 [Rhizopus arrhizus]|nr:hypothetical protein G6F31_021711 [Rhizopus arrhizus]
MTAVALLISPNQKKGSRGTAVAAAGAAEEEAAGAGWASEACVLSDKTRAAPRVGRNCLMAFSLWGSLSGSIQGRSGSLWKSLYPENRVLHG